MGNLTIERFDGEVAIHHRDAPTAPLRLLDSDLDDLVVVLDRVVNDQVKKPSPPPRPTPPGRPQPYDSATAFKLANRALVKIG